MKKSVHKKRAVKRTASKSNSIISFRYVSIGLGLAALFIGGKLILTASSNVHVLGASTSSLLARGGDDSGETSSSTEQTSGNVSNSGGGNSNSNPSTSDSQTLTGSTTTISGPSQDTKVDCIGPDGKHFVTSFHDCQELNVKWNNGNFKFTVVGNTSTGTEAIAPRSTEIKENSQPKTKSLEIKTEGTKTELNLEKNGRHIEIKKEDDGKLHVSSKDENGTEVELDKSDALEKLNESLKDLDIEIGTGSASRFSFRTGKVETHTDFPLSVDPSTNQLSVTTPSGTHELTILPDHAIQNLLDLKVFTNVLSTANSSTASAEASNSVIGLTEINNQTAFEIDGVANKKLLGIFPVAFTKKVFVSSDNGKILKTQQSAFDNFLEKISF